LSEVESFFDVAVMYALLLGLLFLSLAVLAPRLSGA